MKRISKEDRVILLGLIEKYPLSELVDEGIFTKKILPYVGAGIMMLSPGKFDQSNTPKSEIHFDVGTLEKKRAHDELLRQQCDAVKDYITRNLQRLGRSLEDVQFDIEGMIKSCHNKGYDIPLMLSQLQNESHFGTDGGRTKNTKSLFSVGLYDNNKNVKRYETYQDAIDDYIDLMQSNYFQDGSVTIDQLLANFVDYKGDRYASNPNYERSVSSTRNKIIREYPILTEFPQ